MKSWPQGILAWLERFAQAVREEDFTTGRGLFLEETQSFGTRTAAAGNLQELVDQQWRAVWPNTEGFTFALAEATANFALSAGEDLCTVWVRWHSFTRVSAVSGNYPELRSLRCGRCTIVLVRAQEFQHLPEEAASWKAVHSHFSMEPQDRDWERQITVPQ